MPRPGYSDRVHHALAFAAKHHDQQVRRGVRAPYLTHPANVAIILTRYGQEEAVVVAGILHDLLEDPEGAGHSRAMQAERVGQKFGGDVLALVEAVTARHVDAEGVALSPAERRADAVARLATAPDGARWVRAAVTLHHAASLVTDLERTVDPSAVWARQRQAPAATLQGYRTVHEALGAGGFAAPILDELAETLDALGALARD